MFDKQFLIHIGIELFILVGVVYWIHRKLSQINCSGNENNNSVPEELVEKMSFIEKEMLDHREILKKLSTNMQYLASHMNQPKKEQPNHISNNSSESMSKQKLKEELKQKNDQDEIDKLIDKEINGIVNLKNGVSIEDINEDDDKKK